MIRVSLIVAAACAAVASAQEELGARGFTNGEPVYEGEERMLMPSQQFQWPAQRFPWPNVNMPHPDYDATGGYAGSRSHSVRGGRSEDALMHGQNSSAKADPSPGSRSFTDTSGYVPPTSGWTSIGATQDGRQHPLQAQNGPRVNKSDGAPYPQGPAGEVSTPPPVAKTGRGDGGKWFSLGAADGFEVVAPQDTPSADKAWPKTQKYALQDKRFGENSVYMREPWAAKAEAKDPALVAQAIGGSAGFGLTASTRPRLPFYQMGPRVEANYKPVMEADPLLDAAMHTKDQQKSVSSPPLVVSSVAAAPADNFGPEMMGYCVRKDGIDENDGTSLLAPGDWSGKKSECLAKCAAHAGNTGCEINNNPASSKRGCTAHTSTTIAKGNGDGKYFCFLKKEPTTRTTVEAQQQADVFSGRGVNRVAQPVTPGKTTGLYAVNETAAQGSGWFSLSGSRPRVESVPGALPDIKTAKGSPRNLFPSSDEYDKQRGWKGLGDYRVAGTGLLQPNATNDNKHGSFTDRGYVSAFNGISIDGKKKDEPSMGVDSTWAYKAQIAGQHMFPSMKGAHYAMPFVHGSKSAPVIHPALYNPYAYAAGHVPHGLGYGYMIDTGEAHGFPMPHHSPMVGTAI